MTKRTASARLQRGFSLLTGFILAIIMFGSMAFFLAGQGINAGFGSTYSNTSKASGLLTSAGYINTGFDSVTLAGITPASVTFDTTATNGVFNPTSGGASWQTLDPSAFDTGSALFGYWIYRGNDLRLNGVGTSLAATASNDYTVIALGIKEAICRQINNSLHGTSLTATYDAANGLLLTGQTNLLLAGAAVTASPSTGTGTLVNLTALGTAGWSSGCYKTADGNYVYIHTLLAQ